jgi:AcrR family transcriptional regulator
MEPLNRRPPFFMMMGTKAPARPNVLVDESLSEPARQDRSRRAREALLDAALLRFAEHGYDATTVEEIAKHAGSAVGGFYQHFRSKRQVLLILLDRLLAELESLPPWVRDDDAPTILECIRLRFTGEWRHAGVYRAWREAALHNASLAQIQESIETWANVGTAGALNALAAAPGARRNVDVPTLSSMLTVIFLRLLESNGPNREVLADTIVAILKHALFGDPGDGGDSAWVVTHAERRAPPSIQHTSSGSSRAGSVRSS